MKLKLEDKLIRALGPGDYYDTVVPRLVLRVRPEGARRWVVRYRFAGEPVRYRIGDVKVMSLAAAREEAKRLLGGVDRGEDPFEARRQKREAVRRQRAGETVARAVASWLRDKKLGPAAKWKGGLEGGTARSFMPHVRRFERELGPRRLAELTAKEIEKFVSHGQAAATRNRALTALRAFYSWAERKALVESGPTGKLTKERELERSRTLTDAELQALIRGFDATRYGRAVRLLALTGLRVAEVLCARWAWLDAEAGVLTIPAAAEKSGRSRGEPRRVALSPQAVALLAVQREALFADGLRSAEFIFATSTGACPSRDALKPILYKLRGRRDNGQLASTDKRAKPRPALLTADADGILPVVHDVRRTVADRLLNKLSAAPWVVDHVVLGHARPKLLRTYMPTLPLDEARDALTRWADELARVLGETVARQGRA